MYIFLYFFSLIENLPPDRAFCIPQNLICLSGEERRKSHPILDWVFWASGRGSRDLLMHSSAGRLPSNETEMCHRARGDGEDEQKCGQRIRQDEGSDHDCLTSPLFLILSCNGARKYRLWEASQFIYVDPWRQQGWGKPGEWSCHRSIVLSRVPCVSKRGQIVDTKSACLSLGERESLYKHPVVLYIG